MNMTVRGRELFVWHRNKEWYTVNYEKERYELTEKAPKEARESFELFKRDEIEHGETQYLED